MKKIKAKPISYSSITRDRNKIKYIVIHYTAGTKDTAVNEGMYFANSNTRQAGAHLFVDREGVIVKSVDFNRAAWAVGGKKYSDCAKTGGGKLYGIATNANSVSIELCAIADKDPSKKQIEAVKEAIAYIRKYCPYATNVVRHFDVTGKHCPVRMIDNTKWSKFLRQIGEKR